MKPLILYRLHSSKQLVEGTCLFDFQSPASSRTMSGTSTYPGR
jgi:hypothetical protein